MRRGGFRTFEFFLVVVMKSCCCGVYLSHTIGAIDGVTNPNWKASAPTFCETTV
jgi:hypothetical protein